MFTASFKLYSENGTESKYFIFPSEVSNSVFKEVSLVDSKVTNITLSANQRFTVVLINHIAEVCKTVTKVIPAV